MTDAELIAHLVNEHDIHPFWPDADPEALHAAEHAAEVTHPVPFDPSIPVLQPIDPDA